jgi:hypothetical protein
MSRYLDLDTIQNPYGKRVGGGYETVLVGPGGGRTHVKGSDGGPLCMQGRRAADLRPSNARVVTCYRCIKVMGLQSNAPALERHLYQRERDLGQSENYMVPGGRQGALIADKKLSPYGMDGKTVFRRGTKKHPTQSRLGAFGDNVSTREGRRSGTSRVRGGVARPMGYVAPSFAAEADVSRYASPKARRRAGRELSVARRARVREEAMEAAAMEMEERVAGYANNPSPKVTITFTRAGSGRTTSLYFTSPLGDGGGSKEYGSVNYDKADALSNALADARRAGAAQVTADYMEGYGSTKWEYRLDREILKALMLQTGYRGQKASSARNNPNPEAAEAMRLYHSGQARSLKEAWAMVKGTSLRRANGRR